MIAAVIRLATGIQGRWLGCEPEPRQRIYFANHGSNLDGPGIWAALPAGLRATTRPVGAEDYWGHGLVRQWLANSVFRAVLIPRGKINRDNNPMDRMGAALEAGDSLIIFPEGGRASSEDDGPAAFKPGLWHLAQRHPDVELVPVWLENLNRILPKGEILPIPMLANVSFGAPLERIDGEDKLAFLERARQACLALAGDLP